MQLFHIIFTGVKVARETMQNAVFLNLEIEMLVAFVVDNSPIRMLENDVICFVFILAGAKAIIIEVDGQSCLSEDTIP